MNRLYPALVEAHEWLQRHVSPLPVNSRLEIPVLCLRWTQDTINRKMMFGHDESIYKLVDQLQRGIKVPGDIDKQLDVVQHNGNFRSLSNRRLTALLMYQNLHRDMTVKAWCKICSDDTQEFEEKNMSTSDGLGIWVREGEKNESKHLGAPLFQRGEYVMHELQRTSDNHPDSRSLLELLASIRIRKSYRELDGSSLTVV